ncbi:MAG TPA: HD domain-containing phosphohydrolase, partial [Pyrinomonadaceae bacterium]|nr:HD domain-containing phosphohydrolase [Pyrinomonadaceae bacterium]
MSGTIRNGLALLAVAALAALAWQLGGLGWAVAVALGAIAVTLWRRHEGRDETLRREAEARLRRAEESATLHLKAVEALAIAIDAKDQTTHGHARRTQVYAVELGKALGMSGRELEALRAGAMLHDIGKLAVPEHILNKPGRLTPAEFEKMKVHTVVGGDIVGRIGFPYPVEETVLYHHECWDGTGYPKGLKGEQIPLVARVIAVVDFYDTTRCDRPYRAGMSREQSLALLRRKSGSSFDPRVVEAFVENVERMDGLICPEDLAEQAPPRDYAQEARHEPAGAAPDERKAGFRSIAEAQREVFILQQIAQTIGSSLDLQDTVALVASKLGSIVHFDACLIYVVDESTGKARAIHAVGEGAERFAARPVSVGEGVTGWVIANARSMSSASPEIETAGVEGGAAARVKAVLSAPLLGEAGAFGAITLHSCGGPYTVEHTRLLESVCIYASSAVNNALMFERTKESALTDTLTGVPNARALRLMLEQRVAECQRSDRDPLAVLCINLDKFGKIND